MLDIIGGATTWLDELDTIVEVGPGSDVVGLGDAAGNCGNPGTFQ